MSDKTIYWGEKRYHSLDYELKKRFGVKLYKISLNGGMTCPNRDGSLGTNGCIFCSKGGSGDFAGNKMHSITEQLEAGKLQIANKQSSEHFIAYFQAYTNTYASVSYLERIYREAIAYPGVEVLSIATRPDCLSFEVLSLLKEIRKDIPVWIELGLQTIHPETAAFIRRGYDLPVFEEAVKKLREIDIEVIVHTILGLPGEDTDKMLQTIHYLNTQNIQGVKLQLLHILESTDLAEYYAFHPFHILTMEEYFELLGKCICNLRPDIVIHRLTGDGPKSILIEPKWTGNKKMVLNKMQSYFKQHDIWQGKEICTWQNHLHSTN